MRVEGIASIVQRDGMFRLSSAQDSWPMLVPQHLLGASSAVQHGSRVTAALQFTFRAMPAGYDENAAGEKRSAPQPLFEASASFQLTYELDSDEPASASDLAAFAQVNGNLNAVPYWREFLHNVLVRAGLPPFEVPVFNPMKMALRAAAEESDPQKGNN